MNLNENLPQIETSSVLALFETSKQDRADFAEAVLTDIEDGKTDPLKVMVQLKSAEHLIKTLLDKETNANISSRFKALVVESAEKQGGKQFSAFNAKFQIKEAGTVYDYSQTNDAEILSLKAQEKELKERIKEREKFLQMLPLKGITSIDEETGEVITIYPPARTSTTTIAVTLQ